MCRIVLRIHPKLAIQCSEETTHNFRFRARDWVGVRPHVSTWRFAMTTKRKVCADITHATYIETYKEHRGAVQEVLTNISNTLF